MKKNLFFLIFKIISFIIMLVCLFFIFKWIKENHANKQMQSKLLSSVNYDSETELMKEINFDELLSINNHTVGWIQVNGTDINYSVVKADNNDFYLKHSFDNSYNTAGWIFADYRNKFDETDKNIIIYGHNRKDGSMFSSLKKVFNENWYTNSKNLVVNFYTPTKINRYKVFSIYQIAVDNLNLKITFDNNKEFYNYINELKNKSIYQFNEQLTENDSIITLYTCADNNAYRIILHARLISSEAF